MSSESLGNEAVGNVPHHVPGGSAFGCLAAAAQGAPPSLDHSLAETADRKEVAGDGIIRLPSPHHRCQPLALFG